MGSANSKGDKENHLNLYITLFKKSAIEEIISEKVSGLKWEYYLEEKMIDVFGGTTSGKILIIENQLTIADERHLNSLKEVMKKAPNNSIVVWGALGFSEYILNEISVFINLFQGKQIEFYAVEINPDILPLLDKLSQVHVMKVIEKLPLLDNVEVYIGILDNHFISCDDILSESQFNFSRLTDRERTNSYLIEELRSKVKYPNLFREKRTTNINKLRYGAGRTGIDFELVYSNQQDVSYVSCQFTTLTENIYSKLAEYKVSLEEHLGYEVLFDDVNLRIVSYVKRYDHKFDKIDQLVELMHRYILYLCNYTFYYGKSNQDIMWEQYKQGLLLPV